VKKIITQLQIIGNRNSFTARHVLEVKVQNVIVEKGERT
jgi:hypothetical protein